jgi:uncharacterized membrane protein YjjP (DUF1212 family)
MSMKQNNGGADFDVRLQAMFEDAAPPRDDYEFTATVTDRLERRNRLRLLALGAAGAAGAGIAGLQFGRLSDAIAGLFNGAGQLALQAPLQDAAGLMQVTISPELAAAALFGALTLGVIWALQRQSFA